MNFGHGRLWHVDANTSRCTAIITSKPCQKRPPCRLILKRRKRKKNQSKWSELEWNKTESLNLLCFTSVKPLKILKSPSDLMDFIYDPSIWAGSCLFHVRDPTSLTCWSRLWAPQTHQLKTASKAEWCRKTKPSFLLRCCPEGSMNS